MAIDAEVLIAVELSPDDASELRREFESVGLDADLREVAPRRSLQDVAWLALAAVPLQPFFEKLAQDFAADAYQRLRSLVGTVAGRGRTRSASPRVLLLQDPTTGTRVVLEPDLPDEAFELLLNVDLSRIHRGPLHYDRHHRRWRSLLDEEEAGTVQRPPG
jgi:hypothetical protein